MWDSRGVTSLYLEPYSSSDNDTVANVLTMKVSEDLDTQILSGQEVIAWIPDGTSAHDRALITAAPELLAALESLLVMASGEERLSAEHSHAVVVGARKAIALVRGELKVDVQKVMTKICKEVDEMYWMLRGRRTPADHSSCLNNAKVMLMNVEDHADCLKQAQAEPAHILEKVYIQIEQLRDIITSRETYGNDGECFDHVLAATRGLRETLEFFTEKENDHD